MSGFVREHALTWSDGRRKKARHNGRAFYNYFIAWHWKIGVFGSSEYQGFQEIP